MEQNRDNPAAEVPRNEGATAGPVSTPPETPRTGSIAQPDGAPQPANTSPPAQPYGYVSPEIQPTGATYTGQGEPTRQLNQPPPYQYPQTQPTPVYQSPAAPVVTGRPRRGTPIVLPTLLIAAGIILLLQNLKVLPWDIWYQIWRLWPLVLIAIGLDLLFGRRNALVSLLIVLAVLGGGAAFLYYNGGLQGPGNLLEYSVNVPVEGARSAVVTLDSGVGNLTVDGNESTRLASGTLRYYESWGQPEQKIARSGDTVNLDLEQPDRMHLSFGPFGPEPLDRAGWEVHLNNQVPMKLTVNTGVGDSDLDLREMKVTDLNLNVGTGQTTVRLPEQAGAATASIKGGVGSLNVVIPDDVEARIEVDKGIGSVDVPNRFRKQSDEGNDVYVSDGYNGASSKLDLKVNVGVGSVDISSR